MKNAIIPLLLIVLGFLTFGFSSGVLNDEMSMSNILLKTTFEEGLDNWQPRGTPVTITRTDKVANSGKYSLYVSGRESGWHGAQIDLKHILTPGFSYNFEIWVYQETGQDQIITLTMERKFASDEQTRYNSIAWQKTVPSNKWTKIEGPYTIEPGEIVETLTFYVESPNAALDFYIDDFVLTVLPKKSSIAQGTAIPFGMLDASYLYSSPLQIFDDQGNERLNARIIWDEGTLFIYGDVRDETKDPEDGVAIFIDPNNAKTPYLQDDDVWVIIRTDWTVETNKPDEIEIKHFVSPGYKKYAFECSITLPQKFEKGSSIGFDIAVIDGKKMYSWSDTTNQQKEITANYGTLVLEAAAVGTAKYGTPIIDAEIDDIWEMAETYSTHTVVSGSLQNAKADFKVLWDEKALYVLAIVSDPVLNKDHSDPWEQDSVEFFIDENNNKTGFYEVDDAQYRVNYVNEQSFGTGASAANFKTAAKVIDGGYIIEAAISWKTITPSGGEVIGFDVQVNDASAAGRRVGILTWNDPTGNNYQSTVNFGNIKLEK
ncbi:MAG TPA: sugar-binding protein [Defluviitoga sp.]|nr:sugar-binding protein [Defluviitoga sp.]HQD63054.1 sugar-binding protein [Defluviitoga sp.]